jgi:hypothetical protein
LSTHLFFLLRAAEWSDREADICACRVRFTPESGLMQRSDACLLRANLRPEHLQQSAWPKVMTTQSPHRRGRAALAELSAQSPWRS